MQRLLAAVDSTPARVVTDTVAERLVVDGDRVVGVEATVDGAPTLVRARRGVVLTAGGFVFNQEMVAEHCPEALRCNVPIGTSHDDGRGIRMAQGVGARDRGHGPRGGRHPADPAAEPGARHPRQRRGPALHERGHLQRAARPGVPAAPGRAGVLRARRRRRSASTWWGTSRSGSRRRPPSSRRRSACRPAPSPTPSTATTAIAAAGHDTEHHKATEWLRPLEPPYGVVDLRVEKSYYAPFTLGGLATTSTARCSTARASPSPGSSLPDAPPPASRRVATSAASRSATARSSGGGPASPRHAARPDPGPAGRSAAGRGAGRPRRPHGGWPRRASGRCG